MGMKKLCVALVAVALGAVTVAPAGAAQEGNRIVEIESVSRGECLDTTTPYARVGLKACTGSAAQRFEWVPLVDGRVFLRSTGDRKCLSGGDARFREYVRWACDVTASDQSVEVVPGAEGTFRLKYGNRFVDEIHFDVLDSPTLEEDDERDSQRWRIRDAGTAPVPQLTEVVRLKSAADYYGTCVTEAEYNMLAADPCTAAKGQTFRRVDLGDGRFELHSTTSGKCLTSFGGFRPTSQVCTAVQAAKRQWTLTGDEFGFYKVRPVDTTLDLTVGGSGVYLLEQNDYPLTRKWELLAA